MDTIFSIKILKAFDPKASKSRPVLKYYFKALYTGIYIWTKLCFKKIQTTEMTTLTAV